MLHDPVDNPEPDVFNPERFIKDGKIDPNVRDPNAFAFGFGRRYVIPFIPTSRHLNVCACCPFVRICPGQALGNTVVGLVIASVLHVFNITAGTNAQGVPKELSTDVRDGFIMCVLCLQNIRIVPYLGPCSHPVTVPTGLTPRSKAVERLIREQAVFV